MDSWETWTNTLAERFQQMGTMQEFFDFESQCLPQSSESIVEYIYSKNAQLNQAPYMLATEERISPILSGIHDNTWADPLILVLQKCA